MGRQPVPKPPKPPNVVRNARSIRAPTPILVNHTKKKAKSACPNKECTDPRIEDGICVECGTIVDDSNIVAEVQFGESSSGAAVVQGSYLGADQGANRVAGSAFARVAGPEGGNRQGSTKDAKDVMLSLQRQFKIPNEHVEGGMLIYQLARGVNFIQGRRIDQVAASCLYTYCRTSKPCKVMLIDFADNLRINVFKLGHTYKNLHAHVSLASRGINPVLPEDLIYRFADKLDFGRDINKVAEAAIRLAQRMSLDWMVMGRRPSGICGACLILAARMHNFRRTINEVVYVVKVTTATIQKRLDEFKLTPSSDLTIDDFANKELLDSQYDPPSFYRTQEAFLAKKTIRKRKLNGIVEKENDEEDMESNSGSPTRKRHKTAEPEKGPRYDAEGFRIPAQPQGRGSRFGREPLENRELPDIVDEALAEDGAGIDRFVESFQAMVPGPKQNSTPPPTADGATPSRARSATPSAADRKVAHLSQMLNVPEDWLAEQSTSPPPGSVTDTVEKAEYDIADGADDADNMSEDLDTESLGGKPPSDEWLWDTQSKIYQVTWNRACQRASAIMERIDAGRKFIPNMNPEIGDDEFENDPDVISNIITDQKVIALKTKLWHNKNKDWLKRQQEKDAQKRLEELGPQKKRRNRIKKPRIGEGMGPAASAEEGTAAMLAKHAISRKINYGAINSNVFSQFGSKAQGSPGTSRATSAAPSTVHISDADSDASSVRGSSVAPSEAREGSVAASVEENMDDFDDTAGLDPEEQMLKKAGIAGLMDVAEGIARDEADGNDDDDDAEPLDETDFMRQLRRNREEGEAPESDDGYNGEYDDGGNDQDFGDDDDYGGGNVSAEDFDD